MYGAWWFIAGYSCIHMQGPEGYSLHTSTKFHLMYSLTTNPFQTFFWWLLKFYEYHSYHYSLLDIFKLCSLMDWGQTYTSLNYAEAEFLGEIQTKFLRVFLLVIHSHLYSFVLRFLFLQTHATSYSFCKGERRKTWTSSLRTLKIMPRNLNAIVLSWIRLQY